MFKARDGSALDNSGQVAVVLAKQLGVVARDEVAQHAVTRLSLALTADS